MSCCIADPIIESEVISDPVYLGCLSSRVTGFVWVRVAILHVAAVGKLVYATRHTGMAE
jgi:hypothetical protein